MRYSRFLVQTTLVKLKSQLRNVNEYIYFIFEDIFIPYVDFLLLRNNLYSNNLLIAKLSIKNYKNFLTSYEALSYLVRFNSFFCIYILNKDFINNYKNIFLILSEIKKFNYTSNLNKTYIRSSFFDFRLKYIYSIYKNIIYSSTYIYNLINFYGVYEEKNIRILWGIYFIKLFFFFYRAINQFLSFTRKRI